jgi:Domain of unknown function (DUF892)
VKKERVTQLLYEALETEKGGQEIYRAAIECAEHPELKEEWEKYLAETVNHEKVLTQAFAELGLDPAAETPGREVVRQLGKSLVAAMKRAREMGGDPKAAQLVAAECVVLAETKDHANWELIGKVAESARGPFAASLQRAYEQVEEEEDHHLYHTKGWSRELWIEFLGMPAVLPPPEEEKSVTTAIGAARAEQSRETMLSRKRAR